MSSISVLSYDYPPNDGGISRLASAIVRELTRRCCMVDVLTLAAGGASGLSRPDVSTYEVPRTGLQRDLAAFFCLKRLPAGRPVLATVWNPEASLAWVAQCSAITVLAHGNEVMPYPAGFRFKPKDMLRRRVLGAAHAVVCNSRYTERLVRNLSPGARTVVICPAVDAARFGEHCDVEKTRERFGLPVDKRLVLSVSRLDAYKGHDVVLKALARLPSVFRHHIHYAVAGRGDHLAELQRLAIELGVDGCVTWLGFVADNSLPGLYGCADLFVLCTREDATARGVEGFGMVFLEAQAAGLAVLGTRTGGIPDAVTEDEGGWLVPQDDVEAVVEHLRNLAENLKTVQLQGILGRERVRREGTWEKYVDRLLAVIMEEKHV